MSSFIEHNLWLGGIDDTENLEELKKNNITIIINVAEDCVHEIKYSNIEYYKFGIISAMELSKEKLEDIYNIIINNETKNNVLLHCSKGISRSVLFTIYYLIKRNNMSFDDALKYIKEKRPSIGCSEFSKKILEKYL